MPNQSRNKHGLHREARDCVIHYLVDIGIFLQSGMSLISIDSTAIILLFIVKAYTNCGNLFIGRQCTASQYINQQNEWKENSDQKLNTVLFIGKK